MCKYWANIIIFFFGEGQSQKRIFRPKRFDVTGNKERDISVKIQDKEIKKKYIKLFG
jgi:hypothetical protein